MEAGEGHLRPEDVLLDVAEEAVVEEEEVEAAGPPLPAVGAALVAAEAAVGVRREEERGVADHDPVPPLVVGDIPAPRPRTPLVRSTCTLSILCCLILSRDLYLLL